jgi:ribulose-5-phosphate 4-epimerase/fuculose-1-phosphate aldolase
VTVNVATTSTFLKAHAVLAREGHDELHFGHLTVIDRERGLIWIKRGDIGFGRTRSAEDIHVVDLDGNRLGGEGPTHSEVWLHLGIYARRTDVSAIAHSHAPILAAYSAVTPEWPVVDQYSLEMGEGLTWYDSSRLVISPDAGARLADALGDGRSCFLRAHGALVADTSVEAATVGIVELARAVDNIRLARSLGDVRGLSRDDRTSMSARFAERKASRVKNMWGQLSLPRRDGV